jgi:hypothetical protein
LGGNFGGKNLRGKFWREYFGVKFWGIFFWGEFWGKFWREFFLRGDLEGKDHSASYKNVIERVSICIFLCSYREGMASSDKEDFF